MKKHKFKVGDTIGVIVPDMGLEETVVLGITSDSYKCKILNGIFLLPFKAESNYKLLKRD